MLSFKKPLAAAIKPTPTANFHQVTRPFSKKLLSPQELHAVASFHGPDPSQCRSRAKVGTSITAGNVDP